MTLLIIAGVASLGVWGFSTGAIASVLDSGSGGDSGPATGGGGFQNNNFGFTLLDIDPGSQAGVFNRSHDESYLAASKQTGVPFALIKAHAIRESAQKASAARTEPSGKKSYGLLQVLWWPNSNRFARWGYTDDKIGDGSVLYDPDVSSYLGAQIMADNLTRLGNLDDAINAYNTGVRESVREAPGGYVDDVKSYYSTIVGQNV